MLLLSAFLINVYGFSILFFSRTKDEKFFWEFAVCWSFGIAVIILGAIIRFVLKSFGKVGHDRTSRRSISDFG